MRTFVIALLATAALAAAGAPASVATTPKLRVLRTQPLVVAGSGFAPRERVAASALTSLGARVVRARASAKGAFRAAFAPFTQPCGKPLAVRARGLSSGRVALARVAATPCVPPPID